MRHRARGGEAGFTLLEMVVTVGILMLVLGSIAVVFSAMTQGTANAEMNLQAQSENERALLAMVNDLQTTDSMGKDGGGTPYFKVQDRSPGTRNSIIFRKVEGFTTDVAQDLVNSLYSTPIQYYIDTEANLVREQDGKKTVVANRVASIQFDVSPTGCITIDLAAFAGRDTRRVEVSNQVQITPRNTIKI